MRNNTVALPVKALSRAGAKSSISVRKIHCFGESLGGRCRVWSARNGRRKPRVPIEKLKTGGTAPLLKSEDACRIVPSPPSVSTRSIGLAFCAVDLLELSVVYCVPMNRGLHTWRPNLSAFGDVWSILMIDFCSWKSRMNVTFCAVLLAGRVTEKGYLREEGVNSVDDLFCS